MYSNKPTVSALPFSKNIMYSTILGQLILHMSDGGVPVSVYMCSLFMYFLSKLMYTILLCL